ncbi:MAG TPA: alpha/beta fold hydrolase [Streptosporangiaceae bacterium]|nr:alpha/beta fold hydrolase [Streptosporangiaceae bacterium]
MSMTPGASACCWLSNWTEAENVTLRVFCLPHAGGGASAFRAWTRDQPAGVQICAVQLPGREDRTGEPLPAAVVALTQVLAPVLLPHLDVPYVLVGNSVGALVAFDLARQLQQQYCLPPLRLVAAAARPPGADRGMPPASELADAELAAAVQQRYGGIPGEMLRDPRYLEVFLPALRADLAMAQAYQPPPRPLLGCPVTAVVGADDPSMSRADLAGWGAFTEGGFDSAELPGDHFALLGHRDQVLGSIRAEAALLQPANRGAQAT